MAEKVFSVLLTKVSGGCVVRMQLGMINAITNKNDKDEDLNELLKSFGRVGSRQVVAMAGVAVQFDPLPCT